MTPEREATRRTAATIGPYLASGVVLALFLVGQVQSCAGQTARLDALERVAPGVAGEHSEMKTKIAVHDSALGEINRRLGKIESLLERAPWNKQNTMNGGGP